MGPRLTAGVPSDVVTDVDEVLVLFNAEPPIFVVDFIMKNFSSLAMMCLPYVYFRNEFI